MLKFWSINKNILVAIQKYLYTYCSFVLKTGKDYRKHKVQEKRTVWYQLPYHPIVRSTSQDHFHWRQKIGLPWILQYLCLDKRKREEILWFTQQQNQTPRAKRHDKQNHFMKYKNGCTFSRSQVVMLGHLLQQNPFFYFLSMGI